MQNWFHAAALNPDYTIILEQYLLPFVKEDELASYLVPDASGKTPLHYAASSGNEVFFEKYMELDNPDAEGNTSLHFAAFHDKVKIVTLILNSFPDSLNLQNNKGETALHLATSSPLAPSRDVLFHLLDVPNLDKGVVDAIGNSVAHYAVYGGSLAVQLLSTAANIDFAVHNKFGDNPLHFLVTQHYSPDDFTEIFNALPAKQLINEQGKDGKTPLHIACSSDIGKDNLSVLLEAADSLDVEDSFRNTPLDYLCKNVKLEDCVAKALESKSITRDHLLKALDSASSVSNEKAAVLLNQKLTETPEVQEDEINGKEEADLLQKEEEVRKAKEEADRLAKEEADSLAEVEADRLAKEEEERKAKEEADRVAFEEADKLAKEEADRLALAKEEEERKLKEAEILAKEEADRLAKEEADRLAKEEADRLAKEKADKIAKEEADRLAKEEADRLAKEEADRLAKEEADRLAKEEADRLAKEEADRLAKEEADRLAKEEADRLAKEEADKLAKEEADRLAK